jgi:putative membrane protein
MKRLVLAFAAVLLLTGPVLGQSVGEKTGVNTLTGTAPKTEDFVKIAAISNMFEIESSKLAAANAKDSRIKAFAEKMVQEHTSASAQLAKLISGGQVKAELPTALDVSHQRMLDKLKRLKGGSFDKQYDSDQESVHKVAISLFQRYSKGGDNPELKVWAAETLPHLQAHLMMILKMEI